MVDFIFIAVILLLIVGIGIVGKQMHDANL